MKFSSLILAGILLSSTLFAGTNETVTFGGKTVHLAGSKVSVGDSAPQVTLVSKDMKRISVGGKTDETQVLVVVPSIDTPICDLEARTFNKKAAQFSNTKIYVISMDLPFAGKRYCAAHGVNNITVLSDFTDKRFAKAYGTLIDEAIVKGLEARSIFIIKNGKVTYKQLVPEIKSEPIYEDVLKHI